MNDKKWEYKNCGTYSNNLDLKEFNKLGSEGWEFVGVVPYYINKELLSTFAYFKREKQDR